MVELRPYQVADLAFYIANPKCMNLSDPGTGKTPSVVVNQYRRYRDKGVASVWVQPKSLLRKNRDEIVRFTPLEKEQVCILDGPPARITKLLQRDDVAVWLMGPDRFKRTWKVLPENARQACDVDEFHMCFGGNESGRTSAFHEYMRRAEECVLMTGTLIHGRIDTVFPAIHAVEPRYYSGYSSFLAHHAYLDGFGRPFAWKNHERISQILARHAIRRTFEDVYGPESKVVLPETAYMSSKQQTYYDEFLSTLTVDLGEAILDGTAPPQTILVGRKIMEIPFALRDPRGDEFPRIDLTDGEPTGKEELIDIHFADHARDGKPVIVFAVFVRQQERIAEIARRHGLSVAVMNGGTSGNKRASIDEAFRRGEIQVLVCSPQVAAFGYNWQFWGDKEVDHCIFASLDYMDTNFLQAYRRMIRGERKTPLRITVLQYANSMDQRVFEIIETKSRDANKVDRTREVYRFNDMTEDLEMI